MSPRQILLGLAVVFVVAGIVLGLRTITAGDDFELEPIECGSVLQPDDSVGKYSDAISGDDTKGDCASAISDAKPLTYGALGAGVAALIAGFAASSSKPVKD